MINPNNLNSLADELENTLETKVSTKLLEVLSEKQRNFLTVLINKWSYGEQINGKDPVELIKEILDGAIKKIKPRYISPKAEAYLKLKKLI